MKFNDALKEFRSLGGGSAVVASLVVLVLACVLIVPLLLGGIPDPEPDRADALKQAARTMPPLVVWAVTGTILLVCLTFACGLAVTAIFRSLEHEPRLKWTMTVLVIAAALTIFVWDGFARDSSVAAFSGVYQILGDGGTTPAGVDKTARLMGAIGAMTTLLVSMGVFALCRCKPEIEKDELARRAATLRMLLYLSAAGLASGTLGTGARLELQITPGLETDALEAAHTVARAVTLGYGGIFTLFLLAAFLPAAMSLRRIGQAAYQASDKSLDLDAWLSEAGLKGDVTTTLIQLFAALAPLLTPTVASGLAKAVTGVFT